MVIGAGAGYIAVAVAVADILDGNAIVVVSVIVGISVSVRINQDGMLVGVLIISKNGIGGNRIGRGRFHGDENRMGYCDIRNFYCGEGTRVIEDTR